MDTSAPDGGESLATRAASRLLDRTPALTAEPTPTSVECVTGVPALSSLRDNALANGIPERAECLAVVCGRSDDYLAVHGRNLHAPAIEHAVESLDGVRTGRSVTVGLPTGEWAIVVESSDPSGLAGRSAARLRRSIRQSAIETVQAAPDQVHVAPRGSLPFTASGKRQRHVVRAMLMRGELVAGDPSRKGCES